MKSIRPSNPRGALTVFQLYEGDGEWFDLSKKPIERFSFTIGGAQEKIQGFEITKRCTGCKACENVCPQNCIEFTNVPAVINQKHCLHCGKCLEIWSAKSGCTEEIENDANRKKRVFAGGALK